MEKEGQTEGKDGTSDPFTRGPENGSQESRLNFAQDPNVITGFNGE